jgi:uncharacterized membrane protein YeaQ/YmgE (transglycosylase-associated protein family)
MTTDVRTITEVVGLFGDRESFDGAVAGLLDAGFERSELSVLASHEAIEAAGRPRKDWRDAFTAIAGEAKYEWPIVASGAVVLAGGPLASTLAGLVGAAVGGVAVKELLDEMTAQPHTADFARSLEAGAVILWVRADDAGRRAVADAALRANGGRNIHTVSHDAPEPDAPPPAG